MQQACNLCNCRQHLPRSLSPEGTGRIPGHCFVFDEYQACASLRCARSISAPYRGTFQAGLRAARGPGCQALGLPVRPLGHGEHRWRKAPAARQESGVGVIRKQVQDRVVRERGRRRRQRQPQVARSRGGRAARQAALRTWSQTRCYGPARRDQAMPSPPGARPPRRPCLGPWRQPPTARPGSW